jgi:putative membrane protein
MIKSYWLLIGGLLCAVPAFAASPSDFVTAAIKGDNSEIMLGKYAAEHGASMGVKQYGRTLAADHLKAKRQMASVARKVGVSPPSGATLEADAERVKLIALSGKDFDQEFAQYMVKDHQSDIAKFKEEAAAKDGAVSAIAEKQLPTLEKHLDMAKSLTKS